jgi:hypothetical protein
MFNLKDYLASVNQGTAGGITPQQPVQQPQQFDPRVLEAMGLAQGYDQQDERIARQQALADELRNQALSGNGGVDPRATSSKAMWAGALANIGKGLIGGYVRNRADKQQKEADAQRARGMRDFSTVYRGAETANNYPYSPLRRY